MSWKPKKYIYHSRHLKWGRDLTKEQISAMRMGEVFKLMDENNFPCCFVLSLKSNSRYEQFFLSIPQYVDFIKSED